MRTETLVRNPALSSEGQMLGLTAVGASLYMKMAIHANVLRANETVSMVDTVDRLTTASASSSPLSQVDFKTQFGVQLPRTKSSTPVLVSTVEPTTVPPITVATTMDTITVATGYVGSHLLPNSTATITTISSDVVVPIQVVSTTSPTMTTSTSIENTVMPVTTATTTINTLMLSFPLQRYLRARPWPPQHYLVMSDLRQPTMLGEEPSAPRLALRATTTTTTYLVCEQLNTGQLVQRTVLHCSA